MWFFAATRAIQPGLPVRGGRVGRARELAEARRIEVAFGRYDRAARRAGNRVQPREVDLRRVGVDCLLRIAHALDDVVDDRAVDEHDVVGLDRTREAAARAEVDEQARMLSD